MHSHFLRLTDIWKIHFDENGHILRWKKSLCGWKRAFSSSKFEFKVVDASLVSASGFSFRPVKEVIRVFVRTEWDACPPSSWSRVLGWVSMQVFYFRNSLTSYWHDIFLKLPVFGEVWVSIDLTTEKLYFFMNRAFLYIFVCHTGNCYGFWYTKVTTLIHLFDNLSKITIINDNVTGNGYFEKKNA